MNLSRLRLITFNVKDTLLKFWKSPGKQYSEAVGALYGVPCDSGSLSANFKAHWQKMNSEHPNFGLRTGLGWEMWWKQIVVGTFKDSSVNLDDKKLDLVASHLIDLYETSMCWQQTYGSLGLLSYLRNRGIPLGVISNFDPRLHKTLVNTRLRHYFHFIVTSYEVGVTKPHPDIFTHAMDASQIKDLKPDECLHIGNTALLDYEGAKKSGWNAILVQDKDYNKVKEKHPYVDSNHLFTTLQDLHRHLLTTNAKGLPEVTVRSL